MAIYRAIKCEYCPELLRRCTSVKKASCFKCKQKKHSVWVKERDAKLKAQRELA